MKSGLMLGGFKKGMGMLSCLFLVMFFMVSATEAFSQKANYSGTWTLNASKSNFGEQPGRGGPRMGAATLTVTQEGNDMTIERLSQRRDGQEFKTTEKLTLDGKVSENQAFNGTRKSTASYSSDGKTLTISSTLRFEREGQVVERNSTDTWTLSDGGKTLTIVTTASTPRGERKITTVYDKK